MEDIIFKRNRVIISVLGVLVFTITFIGITYACYSTNISTKANIRLVK